MTKISEEFKHDMRRSPEELEDEADRARADLERTLDALESRFSPGEVLNQALAVLRQNGSVFGRNLTTQVRNNPVPLLITGVGLVWLMSASDQPPRHDGSDAAATAKRTGGKAAASVRDAAGNAAERTQSAADSTRAAARSLGDAARGGAHGTAQASQAGVRAVRSGYDQMRAGYRYLSHEQPLMLGALAVAAGAAIGGMLPRTEAEDQSLGEESDEAVERLKQEGEARAEQAKEAAAEAAESASEPVKDSASPSSPS